jgi:RimJ/RimL family protein N-acetyltransferase
MIGDSEWRGKGIAREALLLSMLYAMRHLNVHEFVAKIAKDNTASIKLFERSLFKEEGTVNVFGERTFFARPSPSELEHALA